jgi:hypothetical protein
VADAADAEVAVVATAAVVEAAAAGTNPKRSTVKLQGPRHGAAPFLFNGVYT